MKRDGYVTSARLRELVRESDDAVESATSRNIRAIAQRVGDRARAELSRRHYADHCEVCGYDGSQCSCRDNASPVLVAEYAPGERASA